MGMQTVLEPATLDRKLRELCQCIVEDPEFLEARAKIDAFTGDEAARKVYRVWQEKAHALHMRSHEGDLPDEEDLEEFEQLREEVESNVVASEFVEAEELLNGLFGAVTKIVQKTLQLGHVPSEEELVESGGCESGSCGCSH